MPVIGTLAYNIVSDTSKFTRGMKLTRTETRNFKTVLKGTETDVDRYRRGMMELDSLLRKGAITQKQFNAAAKDLRAGTDQLTLFERSTKSGSAAMEKYAGTIKLVAAALAGALVAGYAVAVRKSEEFESAIRRSTSIMDGAGKTARDAIGGLALDLSFEFQASASEIAGGVEFLTLAGKNLEQSMAALPTVTKFAQAGAFDLSLATDLLTDTQSALGLASKNSAKDLANMNRVGNVLIKTSTIANTSVQQLGEALTNKAAAAARLAGKDVEEASAVLAAFADQGVKGSEAGTAFSIVMRDLQTKAIKNADAFARFGVQVQNEDGTLRHTAQIIGDIEDNLDKFGSVLERKKFLLDLGFSDKSVQFIQSLIGTSEKIEDYDRRLRGLGDVMGTVASERVTELEKAQNRLTASFDMVAIKVGQEATPALIEFMQSFEGLVLALTKSDSIQEAADKIAALGKSSVDAGKSIMEGFVVAQLMAEEASVSLWKTMLKLEEINPFGSKWTADELNAQLAATDNQLAEIKRRIVDIRDPQMGDTEAQIRATAKAAGELREAVDALNKPINMDDIEDIGPSDRVLQMQKEIEAVLGHPLSQSVDLTLSADHKLSDLDPIEAHVNPVFVFDAGDFDMDSFIAAAEQQPKMDLGLDISEAHRKLDEVLNEINMADAAQKAMAKSMVTSSAITAGSFEARKLQLELQKPDDPQDEIADATKETAKQAKRQTVVMGTIRDEIHRSNELIAEIGFGDARDA